MTLSEAIAQLSRGLSREWLDPDTKAALDWLERFDAANTLDLSLSDRGFIVACHTDEPTEDADADTTL